jgi:uncharacterized protein (TIGR02147 family)
MSPLEYTDYKVFVKSLLKHGEQLEFSKFLGCQSAFLSQVLRGKPDLSLEQGLMATEYFKLGKAEADYFMLALQLSRAGSVKLENFFRRKMEKLREDFLRVDSKIGKFDVLDDLSKSVFYSSWKYALVHVLSSIPVENQLELIQQKTGLSLVEISSILSFLKTAGLIELNKGLSKPTKKRIHLSPEDQLINLHHKNFRYLTAQELEEKKEESFHFSAAMALSLEDCSKIKAILLKGIEKIEAVLKPSQEETLRILNIDFFEPGTSD